MRPLFAIATTLMFAAVAFGQVAANIIGPSESRAGDLTVLDSSASEGDLTKWIIPDSLTGRYIETGTRLAFAVRDAGEYEFYLVMVDLEAESIAIASHIVAVTDGFCETEPGEPGDPDQPAPAPNRLQQVSRDGAIEVGDPPTARALAEAIASVSKSDLSTMRSAAKAEIDRVLNARDGGSENKDWYNKWRLPINAAIEADDDASFYASLQAIAAGLEDSLGTGGSDPPPTIRPPPDSQRYQVTMYTREGCGWCDQWKREVKPDVLALGFRVVEQKSTGAVPQFDVTVNGKTKRLVGYQTREAFDNFISNLAKAVRELVAK